MNVKIERVTNSLKGVASVLATMSEVSIGSVVWNEWALHLLYKELAVSINELDELAYSEDEVEEEEEAEEAEEYE